MSHNKYNNTTEKERNSSSIIKLVGGGVALGCLTFIGLRWKVAKPHEYIAKSGAFLDGIHVSKSTIQMPFQEVAYVSMHPKTYQFDLHNMSREKVEFKLPVVFTIGPVSPEEDMAKFKLLCIRLNEMSSIEIEESVRGIIEGETRTLTAGLTIEEMFSSKEQFREMVINKIGVDLGKFGLTIYNANIKEMSDYGPEQRYFEFRRKKAIETANYEAQVEVAVAKRTGESRVAEEISLMRQNQSKADKEAEVVENENKIILAESNAKLNEAAAESKKRSDIAMAEALQYAEKRNIELMTEVDKQRHLQRLEAERADKLASAIAEAEARERLSNADLVQAQNNAKGILANYEATAQGLHKVIESCDGNHELAKFALALDKKLYSDMAKYASEGLQNMKPNVTIIDSGGKGDFTEPYTTAMYKLAPFMEQIISSIQQKPTEKPEIFIEDKERV
jgi:flotillin